MQGTGTDVTRVRTAAELAAAVDEHDRLLVEFYTEGCGACAAMDPVLGIVARATGVPVVTMNPRDDPAPIDEYGIGSVPTLIRFEDGDPIRRLSEGFVGAERVIELLD
ncbi:thioredoxin family protein [Haloplanus halophilus]|uniref:thioredoxin family protein n=1 Tax=Haloplanus halophilus TaxID=2949993 RepID=UPI00203F352A|nr:thioredoxin family protein [Haloplanus sp. GDY1]